MTHVSPISAPAIVVIETESLDRLARVLGTDNATHAGSARKWNRRAPHLGTHRPATPPFRTRTCGSAPPSEPLWERGSEEDLRLG